MSIKFFGDIVAKADLVLEAKTANRALYLDASKELQASATTDTELGYLSGVTSAIQTQINGKLGTTLTDSYIFVGNGSNIATGVAVSGEISLANTGAVTLSNAAVIAKLLTGYVAGAGTVAATDSILSAIQKIDGNVQALGITGLTDNRIIRADGTSAVQSSGVTIDDSNNITGVNDLTVGNDLTVTGNFTVNGTTTTISTTNLVVEDKNIIINDGGTTAGTTNAGLDIEGDTDTIVGYLRVHNADTDKFVFKAPTGSILTLDINADKTLTVAGALNIEADSAINQDLTTDATPEFDGLTINAAAGILSLRDQSLARFYDDADTDYVALRAPATLSGTYTLSLPTADGTNGQVLKTNGSGQLSFTSVAAVSAGDIAEASFAGAESASAANVTGFAFANGTVRAFEAIAVVEIDATADLFEQFTLHGVQNGSGWVLDVQSTGDNSLVTFDISAAGQITYSSSTYAGFTSLDIKFRAITLTV